MQIRRHPFAIAAAIVLINVAEQMVFGVRVIEFYFSMSPETFGELSDIARLEVSLAPVGFVVLPAVIGYVAESRIVAGNRVRALVSIGLSFLGHAAYVLLVLLANVALGSFVLSLLFDAALAFCIFYLFFGNA